MSHDGAMALFGQITSIFATACLLTWISCPSRAFAAEQFIRPEKADAVLALFAPYTLGGEIEDGFTLQDVGIEESVIRIRVAHSDGRSAMFTLAPGGELTPANSTSFAFIRNLGEGAAESAIDQLLDRVKINDKGGIYESAPSSPPEPHPRFATKEPLGPSTAALFAALVLFGLFALCSRAPRMGGAIDARGNSSAPAWGQGAPPVVLVAGFFLSLIILWCLGPEPRMHDDSLQDYMLARDCWLGVFCGNHSSGSFGIRQGSLLVYALAGLLSLTTDVLKHHWVFITLHAFGAVVVMQLANRLFGSRSRWPALVVMTIMAAWAAYHPIIWSPAVPPVALALFAYATAKLAGTGQTRWVWFGAAAAVFAVEGHVVHFLLTMLLGFVSAAACNSWLGVLCAVLLPSTMLMAFDPAWSLMTLDILRDRSFLIPLTGISLLALAAGALVRSRFRPLSPLLRSQLGAIVPGLLIYGGVCVAGPLIGRPIAIRYWAGGVPAVSMIIGLVLGRFWVGRLAVATIVLCLPLYFSRPSLFPFMKQTPFYTIESLALTIPQAQRVAEYARKRGFSLTDGFARYQGPGYVDLAIAGTIANLDATDYDETERPSLRYLPLDAADVPRDLPKSWVRMPLKNDRVVLFSSVPASWVERRHFTACVVLADGERVCKRVDRSNRRMFKREPPLIGVDGLEPGVLEGRRDANVVAWEQELPIVIDTPEAFHVVYLSMDCSVVRVTGVAHEISKDRRSVILKSGDGRKGMLVLRKESGPVMVAPVYSGVAMELLPDDGVVLDVVRRLGMF